MVNSFFRFRGSIWSRTSSERSLRARERRARCWRPESCGRCWPSSMCVNGCAAFSSGRDGDGRLVECLVVCLHAGRQGSSLSTGCLGKLIGSLSAEDLYAAFADDCVRLFGQEDDKALDQVASAFLRTFTKNDHFKLGCSICILLQDNLLTSSQVTRSSDRLSCTTCLWPWLIVQRIIGFSILCELYRNETVSTNPFLPVFLETLEKGNDLCEKKFIVHLLTSTPANREVSGH